MGTSLHWTDESQAEDALLQDARESLGLLQMDLGAVDAMGSYLCNPRLYRSCVDLQVVHAYFHHALSWWEMMLAVIDRGSCYQRLDRNQHKYQARLRQALRLEDEGAKLNHSLESYNVPRPLQPNRLHPWCGISTEVIDVFGQILALCRSSRIRNRKRNAPTIASTSDALADISLAHDLQRDLLAMDFDAMVAIDGLHALSLETGDEKTPVSHLILTAEAYRQASLIQLYLSFEDLELKRPPREHASIQAVATKFTLPDSALRAQKLVAMSMQLVATLELIPAYSGSRCIQPVLLILAAAGLRLDHHAHSLSAITSQANGIDVAEIQKRPSDRSSTLLAPSSPLDINCSTATQVQDNDCSPPIPGSTITQASFEVSKARRFVRSRLRILQDNLPPRPIQVAVDLVNAIWMEYDGVNAGEGDAHWLDVMHGSGLKTMFG
jgi:hypothetical protein